MFMSLAKKASKLIWTIKDLRRKKKRPSKFFWNVHISKLTFLIISFIFSYCTPFVTVVSIQEPSLLSPAKSKSKQNSSTDEEGLQTCGKMVASSSSSSKHLVRRTSSPPATTNQKEPGYVTVLEIGSSNNNNNNNKAEVKRPTHHRYESSNLISITICPLFNQSIKPYDTRVPFRLGINIHFVVQV